MNHLSLATRYRPQRFADVAGQPLAAVALSRAAAEGKAAPAYLLSGTRGVGKTTIARIFAKALNCERAPAAEPCNECAQCRHITLGNHVDVAEIDGASNTGVDDIRALRETIGFMPMEGRYKIFIIDEAHMLSKSAFNALLKTLEEPPANTVFIFATTEAHRFPPTIISRCQHFVFRHLPEQGICDHLNSILKREGIASDPDATRIIARRAAGSVRDSLSLLDQALSVINDKLDADTVRQALGVAGPELKARLFAALAERDCAGIMALASGLLADGIDLAFFTRELTANLRDMFLLRQSGEKILAVLNLARDEENFLKNHVAAFSAPHLHAAWQLALESQRSIAQSPAPGAALELLLINIALLPQLLPVGSPAMPAPATSEAAAPKPGPPPDSKTGTTQRPARADTQPQTTEEPDGPVVNENWEDFKEYCKKLPDGPSTGTLAPLRCVWQNGKMEITIPSLILEEKLLSERNVFEKALAQFCNGHLPQIIYHKPVIPKTPEEMRVRGEQQPEIRLCCDILDAKITEFTEKNTKGHDNA